MWASLSLAALAASAVAQPRAPGGDAPVLDPSGDALSAFHASLAAGGRTRVLVWGASHVSEDGITAPMRRILQSRYGDGGPGLVMPARPFRFYDHADATFAERGAWRGLRVTGRHREPGRYGPAGFAIEARRPATGFVQTDRPVDRARVLYLAQPRGGRLEVTAGEARRGVSTRGSGTREVALEQRMRRVELRARGDGPVRVFGVSLERDGPGVIVDAMGSPGARMRDRLPWDQASMRRGVAMLDPDLLVLAYGTNETGFTHRSIAAYRRDVDRALRRARRLAPDASCVVIGPTDWPTRDGSVRERTAAVLEVQRVAARRHGCGHVDLVAMMGGPGSMARWMDAGLALEDSVHFNDAGHEVIGARIVRALLSGAGSR